MKEIVFSPYHADVLGLMSPPIPASTKLPSWYKAQTSYTSDNVYVQNNGVVNTTIKKCMPVLDDMTAGYLLCLEADVFASPHPDIPDHPNLQWTSEMPNTLAPLISGHSTEQISHLPVPNEYSVHPYKWTNYWHIKTPPGYSCLFRHPFWHIDLPFLTCSGLVDTDTHPITVNFPFLIRKNFEGWIEAGTPIVQIIPFKRQEWKSKVVESVDEEQLLTWRKATKKAMHRYKDNWRALKTWK